MWIGVATQKNALGRLCMISAFFLVWTLLRRWKGRDIPVAKYHTFLDVIVLMMTLWLLKGPEADYSATATVALFGGMATLSTLHRLKRHQINIGANTLTAIMAILIGFGTVTPMYGGSTVVAFTDGLGRDATLTGRTEIWADLLPAMMRQPITGHGFGGFWSDATKAAHNIGEAHSGYLDLLLELGFIGLFLFSMFLLSCFRKAQRTLVLDYDWGSLWIGFLLMAVIHNITETSITSFTSQLSAVLLFLAFSSTGTSSCTQKVSRDVSHLRT